MRSIVGIALFGFSIALTPFGAAQGQALFTAEVTPRELEGGQVGFAVKIRAPAAMVYSVGIAFAVGESTDPAFLQEKARWKLGAVLPVGVILSINHTAAAVAYTQRDIHGHTKKWAGFANMMSVSKGGETEIHFAYSPAQLRELLTAGLDSVRIAVHGVDTATLRSPSQRMQYSDIDAKLTAIPLPR